LHIFLVGFYFVCVSLEALAPRRPQPADNAKKTFSLLMTKIHVHFKIKSGLGYKWKLEFVGAHTHIWFLISTTYINTELDFNYVSLLYTENLKSLRVLLE